VGCLRGTQEKWPQGILKSLGAYGVRRKNVFESISCVSQDLLRHEFEWIPGFWEWRLQFHGWKASPQPPRVLPFFPGLPKSLFVSDAPFLFFVWFGFEIALVVLLIFCEGSTGIIGKKYSKSGNFN
jgi:hypothetical protein